MILMMCFFFAFLPFTRMINYYSVHQSLPGSNHFFVVYFLPSRTHPMRIEKSLTCLRPRWSHSIYRKRPNCLWCWVHLSRLTNSNWRILLWRISAATRHLILRILTRDFRSVRAHHQYMWVVECLTFDAMTLC